QEDAPIPNVFNRNAGVRTEDLISEDFCQTFDDTVELLTASRTVGYALVDQLSGSILKRFLSILSTLIFDSSVDRGIPNLAAAPDGPNTRPQLVFRASSMMFFS